MTRTFCERFLCPDPKREIEKQTCPVVTLKLYSGQCHFWLWRIVSDSAPIVIMAQDRQSDLERGDMRQDCEVNLKAEIASELLHDKLNLLRDRYILEILTQLQRIEERLEQR